MGVQVELNQQITLYLQYLVTKSSVLKKILNNCWILSPIEIIY